MASSLPTIQEDFKDWLESKVRIDSWTLDMPSSLATYVDGTAYPANTAVMFPPLRIEFLQTSFGLQCRAELHFRITYRFSRQLSYYQLPIHAATGVLNNLYYDAVIQPGNINRDIKVISTPVDGIDVQVSDPTSENEDWLLILNPQFYVEFKVDKADLSGIDPDRDDSSPFQLTRLDLAIYRGDPRFNVEDLDSFDLDREISISYD